MVVTALVMEDEEAHRVGLPIEQKRIEDDHARGSQTEIGQTRIEHVARASAPQGPAGDTERPIAPQVDRGR